MTIVHHKDAESAEFFLFCQSGDDDWQKELKPAAANCPDGAGNLLFVVVSRQTKNLPSLRPPRLCGESCYCMFNSTVNGYRE